MVEEKKRKPYDAIANFLGCFIITADECGSRQTMNIADKGGKRKEPLPGQINIYIFILIKKLFFTNTSIKQLDFYSFLNFFDNKKNSFLILLPKVKIKFKSCWQAKVNFNTFWRKKN